MSATVDSACRKDSGKSMIHRPTAARVHVLKEADVNCDFLLGMMVRVSHLQLLEICSVPSSRIEILVAGSAVIIQISLF